MIFSWVYVQMTVQCILILRLNWCICSEDSAAYLNLRLNWCCKGCLEFDCVCGGQPWPKTHYLNRIWLWIKPCNDIDASSFHWWLSRQIHLILSVRIKFKDDRCTKQLYVRCFMTIISKWMYHEMPFYLHIGTSYNCFEEKAETVLSYTLAWKYTTLNCKYMKWDVIIVSTRQMLHPT